MENPLPKEPAKVIQALQSGEVEVLEALYVRFRQGFFRWAGRRFKARREDYEDAWQEAIIAFYEQVSDGRLTALRYNLRTWLFAVGYRRMLQHHRKMKRFFWPDAIDQAILQEVEEIEFHWDAPSDEAQALLEKSMGALSPQCREILVQRFYEGKKIPDIREALNHNSENTTSATLSRCLKRLKDIVAGLAAGSKQSGNGR